MKFNRYLTTLTLGLTFALANCSIDKLTHRSGSKDGHPEIAEGDEYLGLGMQSASRRVGRYYPTIEESFEGEQIREVVRHYFEEEETRSKGKKPRVLVMDESKIPDWVVPGKKVAIVGRDKQKDAEEQIEVLDWEQEADDESMQLFSPVGPYNRKTIAIVVNLQDATSHLTVDQTRAVMASNRTFYQNSTWGQIDFVPVNSADNDVVGPYTISYATTSGNCSDLYYQYALDAEKLVAADGIDLSKYNHKVFILPNLASCSWAGVANVGSLSGSGYRAWIRVEGPGTRVTSHELGHNLGLYHSGTTTSTYADYSCVMGLYLKNMNPAKILKLGTLNGSPGAIISASSGRHTANPLMNDPRVVENLRIVKIPKADGTGNFLLSSRDESILEAKYKTGVSIHYQPASGGSSQYLTTLTDGGEWSDAASGTVVKQVTRNTDGSTTFEINAVCAQMPIKMAVSPGVTAVAGQTPSTFTLTVTNQDSSTCGATDVTLSLTNSTGITAALDVSTLNLAPGKSATATLTASAMGGSGGDITVTAADTTSGAATLHTPVTLDLKLIMDTVAPTAPSNLAGTVSSSTLYFSWTAATDADSGIKEYQVYTMSSDMVTLGSLVGTSATTSLAIPKPAATTYYAVMAVDYAGNRSPLSNVIQLIVTTNTKKGGGKGRTR